MFYSSGQSPQQWWNQVYTMMDPTSSFWNPGSTRTGAPNLPTYGVNATGGTAGAGPVQGPSLANNMSNLGGIEAITKALNDINIAGQKSANAARIPNATGLEESSSANIASALKGEVPQDVISLLAQGAAERGVGFGSGTPNTNAAYLRALGLTSLDRMNTGQQWLTGALGRNPAAKIYDPSELIITPFQQAGLNLKEAEMAQDYNLKIRQLDQQAAALRQSAASGDRQAQLRLMEIQNEQQQLQNSYSLAQQKMAQEQAARDSMAEYFDSMNSGGGSSYAGVPSYDPSWVDQYMGTSDEDMFNYVMGG